MSSVSPSVIKLKRNFLQTFSVVRRKICGDGGIFVSSEPTRQATLAFTRINLARRNHCHGVINVSVRRISREGGGGGGGGFPPPVFPAIISIDSPQRHCDATTRSNAPVDWTIACAREDIEGANALFVFLVAPPRDGSFRFMPRAIAS